MSESTTDSIEIAANPVPQPKLLAKRIQLRPFRTSDVDQVQVLLQCREIAANTRSIEHPYPEGAAEIWVNKQQPNWETGKAAVFAICPNEEESKLFGAIGLELDPPNEMAELGYWIGQPYWGNGYCTEAAEVLIQFGFQHFGLNRIHAHHLTRNPGSGRVLEKIGMKQEGVLRHQVKKWGVFEDIAFYGILAKEMKSE